MGPNQNALDQVKRDAISTTLRHMRDDIESNSDGRTPEETAALMANLERTRTEMFNAMDGIVTEAPKAKRARKAKEDAEEAEVVEAPEGDEQ